MSKRRLNGNQMRHVSTEQQVELPDPFCGRHCPCPPCPRPRCPLSNARLGLVWQGDCRWLRSFAILVDELLRG